MKNNRKKDLNLLFGAYLILEFVVNSAFGFQLAGISLPSYLEWMAPIENMPFWVYNILVTSGVFIMAVYFIVNRKTGRDVNE